ncbi:MAG TPA: PAS domain S-box protein [Spirochaetota bacterium]|nr:PAS domain S-box protein [Spirochaetota bacterium]
MSRKPKTTWRSDPGSEKRIEPNAGGAGTKGKTASARRVPAPFAQAEADRAYRAIVDTMNEGAVVLDTDATVRIWNQGFLRLTDFPPEKITGANFYDFISQEEMDVFLDLFYRGLDGVAARIELDLRAGDGRTVPAYVSIFPLNLAGETHACILITDLSDLASVEAELKHHEKELRVTRNFIRRIADTTPSILHVYDLKKRRTAYSNGQAAKILGYTTEQMRDEGFGMAGIVVHPDDSPGMIEYLNKTSRIGDSEIAEIEYRAKHANGEWRWLRSRHVVFNRDADGLPARLLATTEDITEKKRVEEALGRNNELLEKMFSNINLMIAYLDTDFNYIRVNHAYAWLNGRDPEFYPGRNHFEVFMNPSHRATFRGVVEKARPHYAFMDPIDYSPRPGEDVIYCDWSLQPVREADGAVGGLILSLVDVTEHRRAQEEVRRLNQELEERIASRTAELEAATRELERYRRHSKR